MYRTVDGELCVDNIPLPLEEGCRFAAGRGLLVRELAVEHLVYDKHRVRHADSAVTVEVTTDTDDARR